MTSEKTAFGELNVAELTPMAGWTFAYNVNADLVTSTTTGSGTVTHDGNFAVLSTTAAASSSAKIETKLPVRYITGQGAKVRFTAIFTEGVAGSTQLIGVGDANDGLFFGYNGADFGVLRRAAGVDSWTARTAWNKRGSSGESEWIDNVDPTKLNVYQITFQWLGGGALRYYVENPGTGEFEGVHTIRYANKYTDTSMDNPTLPIMAHVANDATNDTNIVLKTPSAGGGCEGKVENPPPPHPFALSRTLTASDTSVGSETAILTLSNQATWQSKINRIRAQVRALSVAVEGAQPATMRLTKDTTLGGTPSYSDYSANTSPLGTNRIVDTVYFLQLAKSAHQIDPVFHHRGRPFTQFKRRWRILDAAELIPEQEQVEVRFVAQPLTLTGSHHFRGNLGQPVVLLLAGRNQLG